MLLCRKHLLKKQDSEMLPCFYYILERELSVGCLDGDPFGEGEFFDDPGVAESAQTACFVAAEWDVRGIVDRLVVQVGHPRFNLQCQFLTAG